MVRQTSSLVRYALLALACSAALGAAQAQTAPDTTAPAAATVTPGAPTTQEEKNQEGRRNQKIERIHIDDGGAKVDELRYGGQTQNITVTPKGRMPAYEVKPNDNSRTPSQGQGDAGGGTGPTLWNVLKF
jgi:hypothetical protein